MGLLLRFARQWIAGERLEDAVSRAKKSNALGIGAILNLLGEHYEDLKDVEASVDEYVDMYRIVQDQSLDATISIKLTQCGLRLGPKVCLKNVRRILETARERNTFLWFDMEASSTTDATLDIYEDCLGRWPRVGVALQSYLRRSEDDLRRLLGRGGKIRLVKGAYREPPTIAFRRKAEIDANYMKLLEMLFGGAEYFAVATHDLRMIERAKALARDHDGRFEFEMLMGVRDPLKVELAHQGYRIVEYVPYGPRWLPYFSRRLREKPSNLITMVRSMIHG